MERKIKQGQPHQNSFFWSKIIQTKVVILTDSKWLLKMFQLKNDGNYICLIKNYFDEIGLAAVQFIILNKKELAIIDEQEICNFLSQTKEIQTSSVVYTEADVLVGANEKTLVKTAQELKWDNNNFLYQKMTAYGWRDWIEKSVYFVRPEYFKINYRTAFETSDN